MSFSLNNPIDQFDFSIYIFLLIKLTLICLIWWGIISFLHNSDGSCYSFINWIRKNIITIIKNIYSSNMNTYRYEHMQWNIYLFATIFVINFLGLTPFMFTISSLLSFTFMFSCIFFCYEIMMLISIKRTNYLSLILPTKNIYWISPFLIIVEIISYFSKMLSISLRLFANIVAGHSLIKILAAFVLSALNLKKLTWLILFIIFIIIICLECLIAFLQAYVILLLTLIFFYTDARH